MVDKLERIYTIPLTKAYDAIRTKRARRAVNLLRSFVTRHMKSEQVSISNALNAFIWQYSMQRPPRKVKVRAVREDGKVKVYLQDEKPEEKKPEQKKEEKKAEPKKKVQEGKPSATPKDAKKPETKQENKKPEATNKKLEEPKKEENKVAEKK